MRAFVLAVLVVACVDSLAMAQQQVRPQDGGTREVLESIFIPPIPNAPFTATLETEWARPLADGGTYTVANTRRIVRDSAGRVYQERWLLVPKGGQVKSRMNAIQIEDPNNHTLYTCMTFKKACDLTAYRPSQPFESEGEPQTPHNRYPGLTVESLGMKNLFGVDTVGTRQTTTIKTGAVGNDRPIQIVLEFWHSPRLGFNLESVRSDPRIGKQTFTITELESVEPDPALFSVPEGYQVVDQQSNPPMTW
jgi:hypothetical protein